MTALDTMYIERYAKMVVGNKLTIEQVPIKYQEEVKKIVENWFGDNNV